MYFVENNPLRYTDPSGYSEICNEYGACFDHGRYTRSFNGGGRRNHTVITCGVGANLQYCTDGAYQTPYADNTDGDLYVYDVQTCGSKENCATQVVDVISALYYLDPGSQVTLIGHSAGGDATLIAAVSAIEAGMGDYINGVILLDPSMSAQGYGNPEYDPDKPIGGLVPQLLMVLQNNIPVFMGNGSGNYEAVQYFTNPDTAWDEDLAQLVDENLYGAVNLAQVLQDTGALRTYRDLGIYTYQPYPSLGHETMATDPAVANAALQSIGR